MSNQDDFFTPEEVDRQIDDVKKRKEGEQADIEAFTYLHNFYKPEDQEECEMLHRIWSRISEVVPSSTGCLQQNVPETQRREKVIQMQNQPTLFSNRTMHRQGPTLLQRLGVLAATVFLVAFVGGLALLFNTMRQNVGNTGSSGPKPPVLSTSLPQKTPTIRPGPFQVIAVNMSVTPESIAGIPCGTHITVTYKATIHVAANGPGGTVQFGYTINNGRSQDMASVRFAPGELSKTFAFTWSGALPADHTFPEPGGVHVTSPNALLSPLLGPTGTCV